MPRASPEGNGVFMFAVACLSVRGLAALLGQNQFAAGRFPQTVRGTIVGDADFDVAAHQFVRGVAREAGGGP